MSGATIFDLPTVPRLPTLLQNVADGTILIPRFQRTFVWSDAQRLLLLDSVLKGLPIGAFLVWRTTKHKLRCYEGLPPFHLDVPPMAERKGTQSYLLDGLQRLTTLFGALRTPAENQRPASDDDEPRWPIYYDLQGGTNNAFRLATRRSGWKVPGTWLPLSILLDPTALWDFQQKLLEGRERDLARRAELLAARFKDYTVPVIPIHTDELDLATESFQRVNSGGTRLDERHMLHALSFGREWDFKDGMDGVSQRLQTFGWGDLDEGILLDALKSFFDIEPQKRAVEELLFCVQRLPEVFERLAAATERTMRFLIERCGIEGPQALAYSYQFVALVDLCMRETDIDTNAATLVRWVRATTYSGYFASLNSTQLRRAMEHVRGLVRDTREFADLPEDVETRVGPLERFNYNSARTRAFVWTLAWRGPLDANALPIPAARAVGLSGNAALDLIVSGASGTDPANRFIVGSADPRALRRVLRDPTDPNHARVCKSHFIDGDAAQLLRDDRIQEFLAARAKAIWEAEIPRIDACGLVPVTPA